MAPLLPNLMNLGDSKSFQDFTVLTFFLNYLISSYIKAQRRQAYLWCMSLTDLHIHSYVTSVAFPCGLEGVLVSPSHFYFHFQKISLTHDICWTNSAEAVPGSQAAQVKQESRVALWNHSSATGHIISGFLSPGLRDRGMGSGTRKK